MMTRELYNGDVPDLNDSLKVELISEPRPQAAIPHQDAAGTCEGREPQCVDAKSYWLYTNDPYDNKKRREALETCYFERGLEVLAGRRP